MISSRRSVIIAAVAIGAMACGRQLTNNDRRAIHSWLTCDECTGGERAAVSSLGEAAVDELEKALSGPPANQLAVMQRKFESGYRISRMDSSVAGLDSNSYATFRTANYVANYQKRAATALADIGGGAARRALDAAISDSTPRKYRSDVNRSIKFARSRLDAVIYSGDIEPFRTPFADRVVIAPPIHEHFNGQEHVIIEDSLFPPNQIPGVVVGDKLSFVSVAPEGLHMVSVIRPNGVVAKIPMFVRSLDDVSDRATRTCTNIACMIDNAPSIAVVHPSSPPEFPVVARGTLADSLDFFRILNQTSVATPVTIVVEWRAHDPNDLVNLALADCATHQVGQPVPGSTATHRVQITGQVAPNGCVAIQVSIGGGAGPAFGQLVVSSP